ncbi:MAG: hypothetical protein GWO81_07165 [Verrucomicrobia bacterium]|nr:hypothetical protein [Verrucomicrobiota bacterium]
MAFAISVGGAIAIAFLVDHDSGWYAYHMLFGLCAGFLLVVHVILGIVGTRHVNFEAMGHGLSKLPGYLFGIFKRQEKPCPGHNPLAWFVYVVMFSILTLLVLSGVFMLNHSIEEIHEILGWVLLGTVAAHLIGILIHGLRFRENVALSMFSGRKRATQEVALRRSRPVLGLMLLLISLSFMVQLFQNYERGASAVRLPWLGISVQLGEDESYKYESGCEKEDYHEMDRDAHNHDHPMHH